MYAADGEFKENIDAYGGFWPGAERGQVQFIDIDGEANSGEFETQFVKLTNVEELEAGDGNWYHGAYRVDVGTVVMKLKEESDEQNTETDESVDNEQQ